jgi:hypothetical protein
MNDIIDIIKWYRYIITRYNSNKSNLVQGLGNLFD